MTTTTTSNPTNAANIGPFTVARLQTGSDLSTGCNTFIIPEGAETIAAALCMVRSVKGHGHDAEQNAARDLAQFLNDHAAAAQRMSFEMLRPITASWTVKHSAPITIHDPVSGDLVNPVDGPAPAPTPAPAPETSPINAGTGGTALGCGGFACYDGAILCLDCDRNGKGGPAAEP